ncbi:MAG: hypothetical protein ACREAS_09620 [Nitrososphaera sp.]
MTNSKLELAVGMAAATIVLATNAKVELHGQLSELMFVYYKRSRLQAQKATA